MEEELEDMSEKVEDDEEEREVNTVREALALSISSGLQVPKTEQALRKMRSRAAVLHKHPVGS